MEIGNRDAENSTNQEQTQLDDEAHTEIFARPNTSRGLLLIGMGAGVILAGLLIGRGFISDTYKKVRKFISR